MSNNIIITPEIIAQHGISQSEYEIILNLLDREPTYTELGIFSAMWNEHCSYKSSKKFLKTLPTSGERVIQGPGENAGVVDIDDGDCVIFKMESHNHPSFIEPYQGAATGVGGILRDIFTMGARPIASMNALRFGDIYNEKTKHLVSGVVAGIGGYSNSFGVPTVGGEVNFSSCYNGNILVNAFAAGVAKQNKIFYSKAKGVGLPVVYLGAKTGRDGVGGATMASAEFDETIEEKRPTVQVGDPFTEKKLLEACLELMQTGAVIAIQDMGAAGLTCSAVEMGAKGDLGIILDLDKVPTREENMTAYEIMLSESQERMLMVLCPEKQSEAEKIFNKWELDFAIIGTTTDDLRFRIYQNNQEVANLPIKELGDKAPEYDRPYVAPVVDKELTLDETPELPNLDKIILNILNSPNHSSRKWVYEQYDTFIQGNSLIRPGGDAGVVRIEGSTKKALAFSSDVTPRYCKADPYEGGKQAVAECWRNLCATGALPLAATDNLNFGNPEKPEIMGEFVYSIKGISEACKKLNFPIVSGNVSLYNETLGQAIDPTPTIAGVGLLKNYQNMLQISTMKPGDHILLVGGYGKYLGQSVYATEILNIKHGSPPKVDLEKEKLNGDFILNLAEKKLISACHDISDGGLAIAMAEMCITSKLGAQLNNIKDYPVHAFLFGEDQGRYLLTASDSNLEVILQEAKKSDILIDNIGSVVSESFSLNEYFSITIESLTKAYEQWFPNYMSKK
ncbi:phosphoribosylformylglycinamidine synthase subunit PurL [Bartonella sp. DGB1]|uniref:phosphoribosylformylglycinamidine synthase subunit PurL n=1 Tax=Bartonella sp. DGB1 TaxID=3239807 RepID=UPI003523D61E